MSRSVGQRVAGKVTAAGLPPGLAGVVQATFLELQRTAECLKAGVEEVVKPAGLSFTQYNVLRILRNVGVAGMTCQQIIDRMVSRDPDMTRLLDRLQERGLVKRERSQADRRVVLTHLTEAGMRLLESLDDPVAQLHLRQLGDLGANQLRALEATLATVREAATQA